MEWSRPTPTPASRDAASTLFARHWPRAWRAALAVTGRHAMADDVAQDAFERAFSRLQTFDASRPFAPWLHRIVVNRALDVLRQERRLVLVGEPPEGRTAWGDDDAEDPEALAALAALSPERRAVVVLRHLLDYTPPEIAEMLEIPVGTVNSRLGRALADLRERLGRGVVSALDDRLRRALDGLPGPSDAARGRAERAALDALPGPARRRPRWLLAAAAAAAAVVAAGAALAATDRLDVRIGEPSAQERPAAAPASGAVRLPEGGQGLALVADGRLWLATRSGLGVQGLAASAAELSPNATFAAVGLGRSLVAIAPGGRRAWSHPAAGPVVAAAWAPNPIAIAYVVRRGGGHELRVIEGDGDGDRLVDPDVAPVGPSWRADTQALAYVGRAGRARVADYPSLATRPASAAGRRVAAVAYAPEGDRLALATAGPAFEVSLREGASPGPWVPLGAPRSDLSALAWSSAAELLVAGDDRQPGAPDRIWSLAGTAARFGKPTGAAFTAAPVAALAPIGDGGRLAVAVRVGEETQVWDAAPPTAGRDAELTPRRVLLRVPAPAGPVSLSVR